METEKTMTKIRIERYHDISCGHRVAGHENKCSRLHGHNYRFHFVVEAERLDSIGRVTDFSVLKSTLCQWLEDNFDHRFLMWEKDPWLPKMLEVSAESMVVVPFNPTAENIAAHMINTVAPPLLSPHGCRLVECRVDETCKCSATATL